VVDNSGVCSEQSSSFSNKDITFYGQLWKGVTNGADIRKKGKVEKTTEFVERMRRVQEKAEATLRKT